MTTISKATTNSTDPILDQVKPDPRLKELAAKVDEVRATFQTLCQEHANLNPENENEFLEKVKTLSILENEVVEGYKTLRDGTIVTEGPSAQIVTTVTQQLKVLRAPLPQPTAAPKGSAKALKKPAPTQKPAFNAAAHNQRMATAKDAIQALQDHLNTPGADEPTTIRLSQEMDKAFQEVKAGNDTEQFRRGPEFQELIEQRDALLTAALAPKIPIPNVINTSFTHSLNALSKSIAELAVKGYSLEDYTAIQRKEAQITATIVNLKITYSQDLKRHGIEVDQSLQMKLHGLNVNTELATRLEKVTEPFRDMQQIRAANQERFISENYTRHDMGGGGDCLMRAILGSMGGWTREQIDANHAQFRLDIAQHMWDHADQYKELILNRIKDEDATIKADIQAVPVNLEDFKNENGQINKEAVLVAQYIQWIRKTGNWGGTPEIQAISDFLERPIAAVQTANGVAHTTTYHPATASADTLVIMNDGTLSTGGVHFVSLRPKL